MPEVITNADDLTLHCYVCHETIPMAELTLDPWPQHCGVSMLLTNQTDRTGATVAPEDRGEDHG